MPIGILAESEHGQRPPLRLAEARRSRALANPPEPARDGVERVGEVAPSWRRVGAIGGELAARSFPSAERRLRAADLVGTHPLEKIILGVVLADMVEAKEAPRSRSVEVRRLERRLEFAG